MFVLIIKRRFSEFQLFMFIQSFIKGGLDQKTHWTVLPQRELPFIITKTTVDLNAEHKERAEEKDNWTGNRNHNSCNKNAAEHKNSHLLFSFERYLNISFNERCNAVFWS